MIFPKIFEDLAYWRRGIVSFSETRRCVLKTSAYKLRKCQNTEVVLWRRWLMFKETNKGCIQGKCVPIQNINNKGEE